MKRHDFYYDLPEELIAQVPLKDRTASRLMVLDRRKDSVEHKTFHNVIDYLNKGDTLVLNDTRVLPARLHGLKEETGSAIEFLLLKRMNHTDWEILVRPGKKAREGAKFRFGGDILSAEIIKVLENGNRIARFAFEGVFEEVLDRLGEMPLPPYIHEKLEDKERYQTVYAKYEGSAAAPTAGLHFTNELVDEIRKKGINVVFVTLHVGLGTFRPVKTENIEEHQMHQEYYIMTGETADIINRTKQAGNRVIGVGTTSCRVLETVADEKGRVREQSGYTGIYIYPSYRFKILDGLITNFHLPESSLIMLVSALAGYEKTMKAYEIAIKEKYRFFSFGDAMLII